tara:strand:- start:80 stop:334 length:255 start_codon:yes stop_codon:yes gene_type:complete
MAAPSMPGGTTGAKPWDTDAAAALAAVEEVVLAALEVSGPLTGSNYLTQVVAGALLVWCPQFSEQFSFISPCLSLSFLSLHREE